MSESNQLAVKASDQLAAFLGIEKGMMLETLKAQCFAGKRPDEISDMQLAAFVSTANVLQVNPLIPGMLYAYPSKNGGITPILGPDGVFKKLDEHIESGKLEGYECTVFPEDVTQKPTHATATIYRKDAKPATYTALFSEWAVSGSPVWGSKPRHMLWTRAIKQAARQVIHGLPMDAEEYALAEMQNVTGSAEDEPKKERPKAPKREAKGVASVVENVPAKDAPIDVQATAVEPAKAVTQTEDVPAGAHGDATETDAAAAKQAAQKVEPQPRAFLKDAEEINAICEVVKVDPMIITATVNGVKGPQPSVAITLNGEFNGTAYHIGGGIKDGDTVKPGPAWVVGAKVAAKLRGKFNPNPRVNKVQVFVDGVETVSAPVAEMEA